MKQSYLNSERNSAVSLKPLMTIRLLLMVLFVCLFSVVANAATPTITGINITSACSGSNVTVVITGTNFANANATAVKIGTTSATSYNIDSNTQITAIWNNITVSGTIRVTNSSGTSPSTNPASVFTVYALPSVALGVGGSGSVCYNTGKNITVSSSVIGINYQLYNGVSNVGLAVVGTGSSINLPTGNLTAASTTFSVIATNATTNCNATLTGTAVLTVNPVSAGGTATAATSTLCSGSNTTITVSGYTGTIQWQQSANGTSGWVNVTGGSGSTTATYTTPNLTSTTYYQAVVTSGVCSSSISTNTLVTVNPLPSTPTSVTSSATTICSGLSIDLNATSAGNTIYWYTLATGGTLIGTSASGANFTFVPSTSTKYYAEARSVAGCVSTTRTVTANTINVTALPAITTQPVTPTAICAGIASTTISVTVSGSPTYQWRKNGVNLSSVAPYTNVTSATLTITNPAISENGAVFDVVVTKSSCSIISNPVTLTVNATPIATITGASGVCMGSSTMLTAATPGGTWSSSDSSKATVDSNGVVTGLIAGSVTITYNLPANANGCIGTDTQLITVSSNTAPQIEFTQGANDKTANVTACGQVGGGGQNDLDIFSGNPNGNGSNSFGTASGQWQLSTDNGVTWANAPGPTSTQTQYVLDPFYTTFTSQAGVYKFRLIIYNNGCSGISDTITLTVTGNTALTSGTISGNISSCGSSPVAASFTSTVAGGGMGSGTYNYQWQSSTDGVNFISILGATLTTYTSPALSQTTYFRRSVQSGTCSAFSNVLSVLVGAPVANVTSQPSCASSTGTVTVPYPVSGITYTITGTSPITAPVTIPNGIFSGLAPGVYNVVFNAAACTSLPTSVTVNAQPLVPIMPVTALAQPCGISTGTITVTVQNASDTYSFDGGTFQSSNIKSGLASGIHTVIIKNTVGCTSPTKTITISSNPTIPSIPVITSVIHPNCVVSTGTITVTVQRANDIYSFDNGVTFQSSNIKSGLTAGNYNVYIQSIGGCNSSSYTLATINAQPSVPLAPTLTETAPKCATQTGTITITPVSGETYSFDNGAFLGTPLLYSGLAQGSLHTVRAMNAGGCISSDSTISITSLTNTWTSGAWSLGTPTAEQNIVFTEDYNTITLPIIADIVACSCQVASGEVAIDSVNTMTLTNELIVAHAGTLTFNSSASDVLINNTYSNPISNSGSLVQTNNTPLVSNSGSIVYNRIVPAIHNTDYTYWSSPVSSEKLISFSPQTPNKFYSYNASDDAWSQELPSNTMVQGTGYCIYGPQNANNSNFYGSFTGVPNNGPVYITGVQPSQSILVGNPYPSAIDADKFIDTNTGVITGSLYFWTHNTDPVNGQYTYNDYATYNKTGGTGTVGVGKAAPSGIAGSGNLNHYINNNTPNGYIAAGQGFFVVCDTISISKNSIEFNNSMRVAVVKQGVNVNTNSQFFKTKGNTKGKTASTNAIEKDRVWLNLSNDQGVFKQTLVGYITGATNDYDTMYDADSYDSLDAADFYSVHGDSNLVIQGRALPFDENDTVPLGFRSSSDGDYTINIDQVDGVLANQSVFVEDKLTNTVTDLKNGDYKFSTVAGTFNDRFVLKYVNVSKSLSVATDKVDGIIVFYSNNYNTLIIHNEVLDSTVNAVALYNMAGQNISNWDVKDSDQTNIQIPIKEISSGIYIVKVKTTKGESNKKIIVN